MKYDITKQTAPKMPSLGKGTECIKLLISQASKDMYEPLVPMFFPSLGAHVSGAEFQYPDNTWKEVCGLMANIVADSGGNKGQLSQIVEAICRDFRRHDKGVTDKLVEWQRQSNTNGGKDSTARPNLALWFPPVDTTAAGFLLNSMALEPDGRTQYFNLPEVEMADGLCGGHKKVSHMIRNIYDMARAGALRATKDGVTGNPILRASMTLSANPYSARNFYKHELFNGTFGRMVFSYKPRTGRDGRIPRQGKYDDEFYCKLDEYLLRLDNCKGRYTSWLPTWLRWQTSWMTTSYGISASAPCTLPGRLVAYSGCSTIRPGRRRWVSWWSGWSITTYGARRRYSRIC